MALWSRSKVFALSKGYFGRSKNCFRIAIRRVFKALQYQYRDRKVRRRNIKTEWIQSLNAGCNDLNLNYSRFIYGLNRSNIILDRKILANLVQYEPYSFKAVVDEIKAQTTFPNMKPAEKISYSQALQQGMLHYGPYSAQKARDIEFKPARLKDPTQPDWYGLEDKNWPHVYKEQEKERLKRELSISDMKKMRFTAYDDLPSEPDDEDR
jgi:large subunit ribosomal protein L20